MSKDLISVIEAAKELNTSRQQVFKVLKRMGLETTMGKGSGHRGQTIAFITQEEFELLRPQISQGSVSSCESDNTAESHSGVFYLIQLEPEHDPGRFKLGFTSNIDQRLRDHRTAAPLIRLVRSWPCKQLWEKTAIDCLANGCERLHVEVFRAKSIDLVQERGDAFFGQMPDPEGFV